MMGGDLSVDNIGRLRSVMKSAESILPYWLSWVQFAGVVVIAPTSLWVAYMQMQISAKKLRYDLFDRRYRVYEATRNLFAAMTDIGEVAEPPLRAFRIAIAESRFLFCHALADYLSEMEFKVSALQNILKSANSLQVDEIRTQAGNCIQNTTEWINQQPQSLAEKFDPYLALGRRQSKMQRWFG